MLSDAIGDRVWNGRFIFCSNKHFFKIDFWKMSFKVFKSPINFGVAVNVTTFYVHFMHHSRASYTTMSRPEELNANI